MEDHHLVLDSGALSALASGDKSLRFVARKTVEANQNIFVSTVVLAESTTGNGTRDAQVNRAIGDCLVVSVDEDIARSAALLRYRVRNSGIADAIVMATADRVLRAVLLTGDVRDLSALAAVNGKTRVVAI